MGSRNSNVTKVKGKSKTLSMQKRNEMTELVKNLLQVCSEESVNPKVDWENHLKINDLLQKIMKIEPGILTYLILNLTTLFTYSQKI